MKFLINYPTRSRPIKFFDTLKKYINNFSSKNEYKILISCDFDDVKMNNPDVAKKLREYKNLEFYYGRKKTKIDAINRDIKKITQHYDWDVLISAADDMIPVKENYDVEIESAMNEHFPALNGGLWFFDGYRRDLNTLSILGRKRYEEFGYVYYPQYKSWYCDNEYTDIGLSDGKLKFIDKCIIRHEYPAHNSSVVFDELYKQNETAEIKFHDQNLFNQRKSNNYQPRCL
jgi:hypothetical protein